VKLRLVVRTVDTKGRVSTPRVRFSGGK
jgi:hypothetical protein